MLNIALNIFKFIRNINVNVLFYGLIMSSIDAIALSLIKLYSIGTIKSIYFMIFTSIIYAFQPWVFLRSLQFGYMTTMNLIWDLTSDIIVSYIGLFLFKENINNHKKFGIFLAFIALCFMSYGDITTN